MFLIFEAPSLAYVVKAKTWRNQDFVITEHIVHSSLAVQSRKEKKNVKKKQYFDLHYKAW